ncbi:MAG: hypothetical protein AAFX94_19990 [Myxococcota bacterium]
MSAALKRILELEADGVAMSRNRHFDVFKDERNHAALRKWRHVAAVRRSLYQHRRLGPVSLELTPLEGDKFRLVAGAADISARLEWRLHAGEIGLLMRDPDLRAWFERAGVSLPAASAPFMAGPTPPGESPPAAEES